MGELVEGDDGLLAEVVGVWAKEKHNYLCRYIDISRGVRRGFNGPTNAGATYIDLFCGTGRCVVDSTGEWIDGSAVAAWNKSVEVGAPFTRVYIADKDKKRRDAMEARLRKAGAPVQVVEGSAVEAAAYLVPKLNKHALHFAFLDPYSLRALDFGILRTLSDLKRIDMLVHVSQSDLQRNLDLNVASEDSAFDAFDPGWRDRVPINQSQQATRKQIFEDWRGQVAALGTNLSTDMKLIKAPGQQSLYWLLLAAKHDLAREFWGKAADTNPQQSFAF